MEWQVLESTEARRQQVGSLEQEPKLFVPESGYLDPAQRHLVISGMSASVSLIITVSSQEQEHYLAATVESILNQTYGNFELLICAESATDCSLAPDQQRRSQDQRIRVITAPYQNQASVLKAELEAAKGAYLGWIDCGDVLTPTALEETIYVLDLHSEVGLVYTDYWIIDENDSIKRYGDRCNISYSPEKLLSDFIIFQFRLIRRSVYQQVGGIDDSFVHCYDYDLCLKISEISEIRHLQQPLYSYRQLAERNSCERQIERILWAKEAVEQSLKRRKMSDDYELEVQFFTQCSLKHKSSQQSIDPDSLDGLSAQPTFSKADTHSAHFQAQSYIQYENFLTQQERSQLLKFALKQESTMVASGEKTNTDFYPNHRQSLLLFSFPQFQELLISRVWAALPNILEQLAIPSFAISQIECQLTAHNHDNFYKIHIDNGSPGTANRIITYVYYFYKKPKCFSGGELLIYEHQMNNSPQPNPDLNQFHSIEPIDNSIVFFSSSLWHEVKPVFCQSQSFADSRFTVNGWIKC